MAQGCTLWLTGLPGAGKTTIGGRVASILSAQLLAGDEVRDFPISQGLGFPPGGATSTVSSGRVGDRRQALRAQLATEHTA